MNSSQTAKSCEPQLLQQPPDSTWGVNDLGHYARAQEQAIAAGEKSLTACYWRLGLALNLARKHFAHRQWGRYLGELGIEKTRASKARAIHGAFEAEDEVAALTVQEAYRRRQSKPRAATAEKRVTPPAEFDLVEFLLGVCKQADGCADQVAYLELEQAQQILTTLDETIAELDKLRQLFRARVGA